ncbi:MAG TPA: hypothetical protein VMZ28_00540 [Kofleriaceae bacterium]|nr:hypothetical protein [Kofleriaceae bacterium]
MHKQHKKPLRLRKETLRQLSPDDLRQANGGRGGGTQSPRTGICTTQVQGFEANE